MNQQPHSFKNIVYGSITADGNVHIGDIIYNIQKDFHHSILFLRIDKTEEEQYTAKLTLTSKHSDSLGISSSGVSLLRQEVKLHISPDIFEQVAGFQNVRRLDNPISRNIESTNPSTLHTDEEYLAETLFQIFFKDEIRSVCCDFVDLLEKSKVEELLLVISSNDPAISNLPFETVMLKFFPPKLNVAKKSLAINNFGIIRTMEKSLAGFNMQGKPSEAAPLKLLFVTALPENLDENAKMLEVEDEQRKLIEAIGTFEATGGEPKIVIEFLDTASLDEINLALRERHHDIVHISGHGSYKKEVKQGVLHLEDNECNHVEVSGAELGENLRQHKSVKLLILSACETAIVGNGVVEQLAEFGVPALVAMRFSVTDESAKTFTTTFYESLAQGKTLTHAIAQAREDLWQRLELQRKKQPDRTHLAEWFTPVVYFNQYIEALVNMKAVYDFPQDFYPTSVIIKMEGVSKLIGSGFIGRKRYLNQLKRLFKDSKNVCLHGLGGMGKTTLAEAFANNYENHQFKVIDFRGGTSINEAVIIEKLLNRYKRTKPDEDLLEAVENDIKNPKKTPIDKLNILIKEYLNLKKNKVILLFDNFEDVQTTEDGEQQRAIGSGSLKDFLKYLCQRAPGNYHILFTTRYKISDLEEEVVHIALDKMSYAEQYRMANYSEILRGIPMTERIDMIRRLDGHPRAYAFLEALFSKDRLLDLGSLIGKVETQVFENLLLSKIYERLSAEEQRVLQMAGSCITRTPLAALSFIGGDTEEALLPVLRSLDDWSLCFLEKDNRFEVHRLTREWLAQNKTSSEKIKDWALKAGRYYLNLKNENDTLKIDEAILAKDYFEMAEDWIEYKFLSVKLQDYFQQSGFYRKALEINHSITEKNLDDFTNADAYAKLGFLYRIIAETDRSLNYYHMSLNILRHSGDLKAIGSALNNLGMFFHEKGDNEEALKYFNESVSISRSVEDKRAEGITLSNIGGVFHAQKKYELALQFRLDGLNILKEINEENLSKAFDNIGQIYFAMGDIEKSMEYRLESLKISEQEGDFKTASITLFNIGFVCRSVGNLDMALNYLNKSLSLCQKIDIVTIEPQILHEIAQIYLSKGNANTALQYFDQALELSRQKNDKKSESKSLYSIGLLYQDKGDYDSALNYFEESLNFSRQINDLDGERATLTFIANLYKIKLDFDKAIQYFEESLRLTTQVGDGKGMVATMNNISLLYLDKKDYDVALNYIKECLNISRQIGDKGGECTTLNNFSVIYAGIGDDDQALKYLQDSYKLAIEIGDRKGAGITMINMGQLYLEYKNYKSALMCFEVSYKTMLDVKFHFGIAKSMLKIGEVHFLKEDFEIALLFLVRSYLSFQQLGTSDIKASSYFLSEIQKQMGEVAYQTKVQQILSKQ